MEKYKIIERRTKHLFQFKPYLLLAGNICSRKNSITHNYG